jgi:hypothetical protein
MNDQEKADASEEPSLPPFKVVETDNYVTAIIGGESPSVSGKKEFKGFLEMLADMKTDPSLKEQLLDTLKASKSAAAFLIETLDNPDFNQYKQEVLAMCWEAGIDMTAHLNYFINFAASLEEPLLVLEVQTIIQDMDLSNKALRDAAILKLKKAIPSKKDEVSKEIANDILEFLLSRD